jgi:antitoxin component of MazEF toxin-antitoxin module
MSDAVMRPSKIAQWGNGAAVRIGAAALERAQMQISDAVDIIAHEGEIIIRRQRPKVSMADLLAQFDPAKHRHDLSLDDPPAGSETR